MRDVRANLHRQLEEWLCHQDPAARIVHDPVVFPRRYRSPDDIEIAGLIAATFAYGHVRAFWPMVERLLRVMDDAPADYLRAFEPERERPRFRALYYRFSGSEDLLAYLWTLKMLITAHGSLRRLFESLYDDRDDDIGPLLARYVETALAVDTHPVYGHRQKPDGLLHLFSGPAMGGASKRLCLYLRWMVRPADGVDLGLWPEISPAKLVIPLDAHVVRIGRYLGLTSRKSPGWLMAQEMTARLRTICPDDPVKYDFALCHHGMSGACPSRPLREHCAPCGLRTVCRLGRQRFPAARARQPAAVSG